jgi:HD-GYP domain-containing protein (c-di-GMP phosphodiesterase class II)
VSDAAVRAATAMGLPSDEIERIAEAALLHDIGKIGMSDLLLLKRSEAMSPDEKKEYRLHAVRGQAAIDHIEDLRDVGILIRHHHEAFNGTGYPDGLKGDEIPIGARIITAADLFDRLHAQSQSVQAVNLAMGKMREEAGKTLDPAVFAIIERHLREKYASAVPASGMTEREIPLKDLTPGMTVSRDVRTGTGILLGKGVELDSKKILALKRYEQVDPMNHGVYVWFRK